MIVKNSQIVMIIIFKRKTMQYEQIVFDPSFFIVLSKVQSTFCEISGLLAYSDNYLKLRKRKFKFPYLCLFRLLYSYAGIDKQKKSA